MPRNFEDPIVIRRESNGDNTDDIVIGSPSRFSVSVVSNDEETVYAAKYGGGHYYSYEGTLPSDAHVEVKR